MDTASGKLSKIAKSEHQAAYKAFLCGLKHRFTYNLIKMPYLKNMLQPLDEVIENKFIPAISDGHICSSIERRLLSLPHKSGGLGILIFVEMSQRELTNSKAFCEPLTRNIVVQDQRYLNYTHQSSDIRKLLLKADNKVIKLN